MIKPTPVLSNGGNVSWLLSILIFQNMMSFLFLDIIPTYPYVELYRPGSVAFLSCRYLD